MADEENEAAGAEIEPIEVCWDDASTGFVTAEIATLRLQELVSLRTQAPPEPLQDTAPWAHADPSRQGCTANAVADPAGTAAVAGAAQAAAGHSDYLPSCLDCPF